MSEVKIKFDSNQEYQINAVNAVIDLFEGREKLELEEEQSFYNFLLFRHTQ